MIRILSKTVQEIESDQVSLLIDRGVIFVLSSPLSHAMVAKRFDTSASHHQFPLWVTLCHFFLFFFYRTTGFCIVVQFLHRVVTLCCSLTVFIATRQDGLV